MKSKNNTRVIFLSKYLFQILYNKKLAIENKIYLMVKKIKVRAILRKCNLSINEVYSYNKYI